MKSSRTSKIIILRTIMIFIIVGLSFGMFGLITKISRLDLAR